jgi:hypothetical protein
MRFVTILSEIVDAPTFDENWWHCLAGRECFPDRQRKVKLFTDFVPE